MSCGTRVPFKGLSAFAYRAVTVYGRPFHAVLLADSPRKKGPTTPELPKQLWFGLVPVRSPLLGESQLISIPTGTEMFHFPAFASSRLCIQRVITPD